MSETNTLFEAFCEITDPVEMEAFFTEIFTPAERHDFHLRWKLMKYLKEGRTQRNIASDLGISLCKITRGAKILKNKKSVTNKYI